MTEPKRIYLLMLASVLLLSVSKIFDSFSFLIFISLSPLFAIFDESREGQGKPLLKISLNIAIVLTVSFLLWNLSLQKPNLYQWFLSLAYGLGISCSFILFAFSDRFAKNRLGFFTILIYWLALEYLFITINPQFARYLLGSVFNMDKYLISWNLYTGLIGVSLWVLLVNILFYYALLKDSAIFNGQIRWISIAYTLLVICIPFFINTSSMAILPSDIINEMSQKKQLAGNGEYIGKTAAWVSVLVLIYSFIKLKIQK